MKLIFISLAASVLTACAWLPGKPPQEVPKIPLVGTPLVASIPKLWVSNPYVVSQSPTLVFDAAPSSKKDSRPPNLKIAQISSELKQDTLAQYAEDDATFLLTPRPLEIDGRPALELATGGHVRYSLAAGDKGMESLVEHAFFIRDGDTDYQCVLKALPDRYKGFKKEFRSICMSLRFVKQP